MDCARAARAVRMVHSAWQRQAWSGSQYPINRTRPGISRPFHGISLTARPNSACPRRAWEARRKCGVRPRLLGVGQLHDVEEADVGANRLLVETHVHRREAQPHVRQIHKGPAQRNVTRE
eukprot:6175201-Pleurochrysis_carterae.AAC.2